MIAGPNLAHPLLYEQQSEATRISSPLRSGYAPRHLQDAPLPPRRVLCFPPIFLAGSRIAWLREREESEHGDEEHGSSEQPCAKHVA